MHLSDAAAILRQRIEVGHEMVALAKAFIVSQLASDVSPPHPTTDVDNLRSAWLRHVDAQMPERVVVNRLVDPEPVLSAAARSVSVQLAFCEAVWSLIHSGVVLPATANLRNVDFRVGYTTVFQNSGGQTGSWPLDEFKAVVPHAIWLAPSFRSSEIRPLSDGDLFIREVDIADVHPLVEESLIEAVTCFRHDLYAPCLAMLTRAVEAAWSEMGLAIADAVQTANASRAEAIRNDLVDAQYSLSRRLTRVADLYDEKTLCEPIWKAASVRPRDLRNVMVWADQVRDSRNVLHYQAQPAMANTYEKVAALLIGAVPYLRTIYAVHHAALVIAS